MLNEEETVLSIIVDSDQRHLKYLRSNIPPIATISARANHSSPPSPFRSVVCTAGDGDLGDLGDLRNDGFAAVPTCITGVLGASLPGWLPARSGDPAAGVDGGLDGVDGAAAVAGVGGAGEGGATGGVPGTEAGVPGGEAGVPGGEAGVPGGEAGAPGGEAGVARGEEGFAGGSLGRHVGNGTCAAKSSCLSPHFGQTKVRDLIASLLRSSGGQSRAPIAPAEYNQGLGNTTTHSPWPSVGIKATRAVIIVRMSQLGCQCSG